MPRGVNALDRAFLQGRTFAPSVLAPSLVAWWDADDLSTIAVSTGVSEFRDKSGNGRHLSQATGSRQPALNIGDNNGRNSIKFTRSSNQLLTLSNFITTGATNILAIFAMIKYSTTGTLTTDEQRIIDNNGGNGIVWRDAPAAANQPFQVVRNVTALSDTSKTGDDTWKVISTSHRATSPVGDTIFVNGTQKATNSVSTLTLNADFGVGARPSAPTTNNFNGSLSELIIVTDTSAYTRWRIEGYLAWKYGTVGTLDAANPFLSRPPMIGD